ncbi:Bro-N domain-containing protein [Pseudomonas sp. NPDC088368]|uniref:BRO-N domain-containing protein n=1 Tax=Pseudomonas sp. NPDC088368 TaxID=3364453 RepID=UPI0037FAECDE
MNALWHETKKPRRVRDARASGNEINFEEEIVMVENITDVTAFILFRFDQQQVRTLLIDGSPWFVATDVCDALAIVNTARALSRLDDDEKGIHSMNTPGGRQNMSVVNESGLYSLILTSRKVEAKRFKKWVTAEVLPAIRKHGRYEDHGKMATLLNELISMSELNVIKGLIRDKAKAVAPDLRQGFQLVMHNRLHTRFNVPRTEMIPASQFDQACNFIGSYALEGEYLPHQSINIPEKLSHTERYLVSAGANGERQITSVPFDACIMTIPKFMALLGESGGLMVSTDDLFSAVLAITDRLRGRSTAEMRRVAA